MRLVSINQVDYSLPSQVYMGFWSGKEILSKRNYTYRYVTCPNCSQEMSVGRIAVDIVDEKATRYLGGD